MSFNIINHVVIRGARDHFSFLFYVADIVAPDPSTARALVLIAREPVISFTLVSQAGFTELGKVSRGKTQYSSLPPKNVEETNTQWSNHLVFVPHI